MKKFRFGLETVLSYKNQILESLQVEHAAVIAKVRRQEECIEELWRSYYAYSDEYTVKCAQGMEITMVLSYQAALRAREREIEDETRRLEEFRKEEEAKRSEVVEAKKDTSTIEKLREKKLDAYHAAEAKSEELRVEEFVSSRSIVANNASIG